MTFTVHCSRNIAGGYGEGDDDCITRYAENREYDNDDNNGGGSNAWW